MMYDGKRESTKERKEEKDGVAGEGSIGGGMSKVRREKERCEK